eukprot:NODE_310_length_10051_cov_0.839228.p4 type:complete len:289 gc:universal NODE_310_length_10051_cov_0.839228:5808-4942(-)
MTQMQRYFWIWNTESLIQHQKQIKEMLTHCQNTQISLVILYAHSSIYSLKKQLTHFIQQCSKHNIKVMAMDGERGHFNNPSTLYESASKMMEYNEQVNENQRFIGFHTDVEPMDRDGHVGFYDRVELKDMTKQQLQERTELMNQWIQMHLKLREIIGDLSLSVALPTWIDDYYGGPLMTSEEPVLNAFLRITNEIIFMSYNTWPENVVNRIIDKLKLAQEMQSDCKLMNGLESEMEEEYVSYATTPGKQSKKAALTDLEYVEKELGQFPNYGGSCIHHLESWIKLQDE